jgi:creatinine amidohydrolase
MLEKEIDLVILPPFYYGAGSYAVAGPERKGGMHIDADTLNKFARQLFYNLLRIGFRNIYVFFHHQSENFVSGMPTDLAFRLAAKQEIFAFIEREKGDGWWGEDTASANYYEEHDAGSDPIQLDTGRTFYERRSSEAVADRPCRGTGNIFYAGIRT